MLFIYFGMKFSVSSVLKPGGILIVVDGTSDGSVVVIDMAGGTDLVDFESRNFLSS